MNELEERVREMLRRRAAALPAQPGPSPRLVRRARRRIALHTGAALLAVGIVAAGAVGPGSVGVVEWVRDSPASGVAGRDPPGGIAPVPRYRHGCSPMWRVVAIDLESGAVRTAWMRNRFERRHVPGVARRPVPR